MTNPRTVERPQTAASALACALAWTLASAIGCGGAPPAQTGGASSPPPTEVLAAEPASRETSPGAAAEPPASAELTAGIKAFDAGNYAAARKSFEAGTKKNPQDYNAFFNLGQACEKLGDKAAAESAYKTALTLKPDLDAAAEDLSALDIDLGKPDDAIAVARACLAKKPGNAALHENLGVALAARGDQENAVKELDEAVKITPTQAMYHFTYAHWLNAWHAQGATAHLDTALGLVKDDYAMLASIGYEYRMAGAFDPCVKTYDRAIGIKDGGEVRTQRALCRLGLKDDKGALEDLQAAVANEPSYAQAHYYLAGRLAVGRRFKDAAAEYAKYLQIDPNGSLAAAATAKMKASQDAMSKDKGGVRKK